MFSARCSSSVCAFVTLTSGIVVASVYSVAIEAKVHDDSSLCVTRLGSCNWFPCSELHGEFVDCVSGVCTCAAGFCAPDGFRCENATRDVLQRYGLRYDALESDSKHASFVLLGFLVFLGIVFFLVILRNLETVLKGMMVTTSSDMVVIERVFVVVVFCFVVLYSVSIAIPSGAKACDNNRPNYHLYQSWKLWFGVLTYALSFPSGTMTIRGEHIRFPGYLVNFEDQFRSIHRGHDKINQMVASFQLLMHLVGVDLLMFVAAERHYFLTLLGVCAHICVHSTLVLSARPASFVWHEARKLLSRKLDALASDPSEAAFWQVRPSTIYQDLTEPFGQKCVVIFCGQSFLTFLYGASLRTNTYLWLCHWEEVRWGLWASTILVQYLLMVSVGTGFTEEYFDWAVLLHSMPTDGVFRIRLAGDTTSAEVVSSFSTKHEFPTLNATPMIKTRLVMSFICNCVITSFLIYTVPLVLISNQGGMDYVKDCLAVAFITQLDDKSDSTDYEVEITAENRQNLGVLARAERRWWSLDFNRFSRRQGHVLEVGSPLAEPMARGLSLVQV